MAHTLIRVYDNLLAAQNARTALLGSGFSPSCVQLDTRGDEAGPVDGNFILDYKDTPRGPRAAFYSYLFGKERGRAGEADADASASGCLRPRKPHLDGRYRRRRAIRAGQRHHDALWRD